MQLNKKTLGLAIAFQLLILAGMFAKAYYPILTGTDMVLRPEGRDPRDIFAGNYVTLNYSFNQLYYKTLPNDLLPPVSSDDNGNQRSAYKYGDALYLEMDNKNGFYEPVGIWTNLEKASQNKHIALRVIVDQHNYWGSETLNLKAGLESYFTTPETAKMMEDLLRFDMRDSIVVGVDVKVADNGTARINGFHWKKVGQKKEVAP